jgi:hypothetical protein
MINAPAEAAIKLPLQRKQPSNYRSSGSGHQITAPAEAAIKLMLKRKRQLTRLLVGRADALPSSEII